MKLNKIKYAIAALFTAALPIEAQAQVDRVPFTSPEYLPGSPLRADGCDTTIPNGNANGEIDLPPPVPISGGLWILAGSAIVYGIVRKKRKSKKVL